MRPVEETNVYRFYRTVLLSRGTDFPPFIPLGAMHTQPVVWPSSIRSRLHFRQPVTQVKYTYWKMWYTLRYRDTYR